MTIHFPNAPLIEIIAEVEWAPLKREETSSGDAYEYVGQSPHTRRLSSAFASAGFSQIERLAPVGYEVTGPQLKFSSPADPMSSVSYKIGDTGLSVSAIPPYQHWDEFLPEIRRGLEILLAETEDDSRPTEFLRVSLNYVDAFGEEFWAGTSRQHFLTEELGFKVTIPTALQSRLTGDEVENFFVDTFAKTHSGDRASIKAGFATVLGEPKVILDLAVRHEEAVAANVQSVISVLESAHTFIHDSFIELTRDFAEIMHDGSEK